MYPVNKTCARVFYSERIQLSVSPKSFGKTVHFTNRKSRICTKTEVLYLIEEWEKNVRFDSFLPKTRSILHVKNTCKRCWGIKKGFEYRDCENETHATSRELLPMRAVNHSIHVRRRPITQTLGGQLSATVMTKSVWET